MSRLPSLSYDVLILVLEWIQDDYPSLFSCSLVDRTFRDASARYLYRKVTYAPGYSLVLDLRRKDDFLEGIFLSARLPHNAPLVRRFEVSGFLSSRPPPINKFPAYVRSAVECWPNLQALVFSPQMYHESLFNDTLPLLPRLTLLKSLSVNTACTNESHVDVLVQVRGLEILTIQSPTRAILQLLPDWIGQLQNTLRILRLTNSCGSVTPGVLRSFVPYLQRVTSFELGLSYSLTDDDIFAFWEELPSLHTVSFRYYLQLRPSHVPYLPHLRDLTIYYTNTLTRDYTDHLCRWIRRLISKSPLISLRLLCENGIDGPSVSFDPLAEHLSLKHATRLRALEMPHSFVGRKMFITLCSLCSELEELTLGISSDALGDIFSSPNALHHLHTATFYIRNRKRRLDISQSAAEAIFMSIPRLRRLTVDGKHFEVCQLVVVIIIELRYMSSALALVKGMWTAGLDGNLRFTVEQVHGISFFRWERGSEEAQEHMRYNR
ncbi:hypothetical protein C8Q79DRAFT_1004016 [Trametes meyenii]|nr:hypothetical protein C8Q79DRAFT_1004016 [Trametes meyenii]